MRKERKFLVVIVKPGHGTVLDTTPQLDRTVSYAGESEAINMDTPRN
jgi:hypothetical protein